MFFGGLFLDPLYLWIFLVTILISGAAQLYVRSAYSKWGKVPNGAGLSGIEAGYAIVNRTDLGGSGLGIEVPELRRLRELQEKGDIAEQEYKARSRQVMAQAGDTALNRSTIVFEPVPGALSDHYDPRSHTVRLSEGVASKKSVAAMAIVAHELGHAQQHESNSVLISMRNVLVPAVSFSPQIAYILILIGFFFNLVGAIWLGILFYGLMVVFSVLTLPVEIDASRRGIRLLREAGLMQVEEDEQGARNVLTAAATTYIAAAVTAVLTLLYYITIARRRR
ncbi:MAG: zinc metallopeptidase [Anaerolineales bacterium]